MCPHLEDLLDSMNQYFPKEQWEKLLNHAWVKDLFKVQHNQWILVLFCLIFNFEVTLDLWKSFSCSENFPYTLHLAFTNGYILCHHDTLTKTRRWTWPMDFNRTKYNKFTDIVSDFTSQQTFKKLPL